MERPWSLMADNWPGRKQSSKNLHQRLPDIGVDSRSLTRSRAAQPVSKQGASWSQSVCCKGGSDCMSYTVWHAHTLSKRSD